MSTASQHEATVTDPGVVTVEDVWRRSDVAGVPSCAILAAVQKLCGWNSESVCDCP
jgi:hypothetical protein